MFVVKLTCSKRGPPQQRRRGGVGGHRPQGKATFAFARFSKYIEQEKCYAEIMHSNKLKMVTSLGAPNQSGSY